MTTQTKCFLCGTECECEWSGSDDQTLWWYTCSICGRFGVSMSVRVEAEEDEKNKVALSVAAIRIDKKKVLVFYKDVSEVHEVSRDCTDVLNWDELISKL